MRCYDKFLPANLRNFCVSGGKLDIDDTEATDISRTKVGISEDDGAGDDGATSIFK